MVTIVKHEWHQHDRQYAIELDEALLSEIYPDLDEDEIATMIQQIVDGEVDYEDVINEAWENDVEIEWEFQYDDCWTDRKGGYEVTYEIGDDSSWVEPEKEAEPTHKCTKCRWTGQSYQTLTAHLREDGSVIEDYYSTEEESHHTSDTCPMCDSLTELTEVGIQEEKERAERHARWEQEAKDSEEAVPCFSCGAMHKESELPELSGQYHCPDCHEGWVMMEFREEDEDDSPERQAELAEALEELKREFDTLMSHTHSCTECDWTGNQEDQEKDGTCPNCGAHTETFTHDDDSDSDSSSEICPMKCTQCEWTGDWTDTETNEHQEDVCPDCGADVEDVVKD